VERRAWARREKAVSEISALPGLADVASTDLAQVVAGADLIILAMPIDYMADVVSQMEFSGGAGALITDVGSVKGSVQRDLSPLARERGVRFLGSHPMAGSEKTGLAHADKDLFEGATVILTPDEFTESDDLSRLSAFWEHLGGQVFSQSPGKHDETVAAISHLPHLVASALVRSTMGEDPQVAEFCGGGFRDTTRVAAGPAEMWRGILSENREALGRSLDDFIQELETWKDALDSLDSDRLQRFLSESQDLRNSI